MKKIYFIKNEDDFRSLMVDLEKEGAKWASGHKPTEAEYSRSGKLIAIKDNIITFHPSIRTFSNALEYYGIEEEIHIIPYTAKPENLGYSFKEILDMEWKRDWKLKYEYDNHNGYSSDYLELDELMFNLGRFYAEEVHKILSEGRFFIDKGE